jgi:serine/threonine protein kinase
VSTLLPCYECVEDGDDILIAHQLFPGKPLSLYLNSEWRFGERDIQEIMIQILIALESIHARSLIHGRLMLENVLYDHENSDVRLTGFLHINEGSSWGAERRRIDRYLAPEFFMFSEYSYSSEIYSIAIMMMELLNGKRWLENLSDERVIAYQVNKGFRFPKVISSEVSKKLRDIIERALDVDSNGRFETLGDMRQAFYGTAGMTVVCEVPDEDTKVAGGQTGESLNHDSTTTRDTFGTLTPNRQDSGSPELSSSVRLMSDLRYRPPGVSGRKNMMYLFIALVLLVFVINDFEFGVPGDEKFIMLVTGIKNGVQAFFELF